MNQIGPDGHLTDEATARYVEALRADDVRRVSASVRRHIEDCDACSTAALALYSIEAERDWQQDRAATGARIRHMPYLRWAVVAMLAGISFYFYRYLDAPAIASEQARPVAEEVQEVAPKESEPVAIPEKAPTESVPKETNAEVARDPLAEYAANFVPSAELEVLLDDVLRGEELKLISPAQRDSLKVGEVVRFEWEGPFRSGLQLRIKDNTGEEIAQYDLNELRYEWKTAVAPGLYYWQLETEEDLLLLGRLFLR